MSDLIVAYLFLGGTGAGLFFWVAAFRLLGIIPDGYGLPARRGLAVAEGMLVLGCVCLLCDLGYPRAILAMFFPSHLNYITVGAWALAGMMLVGAALLWLPPVRSGARRPGAAWESLRGAGRPTAGRTLLYILAMVLGLYVMVYTGLLLRLALGVDLWNSGWLPVLFLCSSLSSGYAAFTLCARMMDVPAAHRQGAQVASARLDGVLVAFEALAAVAFILHVGSQPFGEPALQVLWQGSAGAMFIAGFCGIGLAVPLVADGVAFGGKTGEMPLTVAAMASLAGAFCLRYALVVAGVNVLF